jgi:hypothetical protein
MDLQSTIMEEVILKNYKLLQYVENEMNQLKDEMNLLKKENAHLKKEINLLKDDNIKLIEENKINKNLFCNIQNIQDTIENTMIIGYDMEYMPISWNIDKALLIPSFKESTDLCKFLQSYSRIISLDVFKHLNKYNNFKTFTIKHHKCGNFIDEKFNKIQLNYNEPDVIYIQPGLPIYNGMPPCIKSGSTIGTIYNDYIKLLPWIDNSWFHKQNLKKLLNILDECNIKLMINSIGCDDKREDLNYNGKRITIRELILS